jgi:hypothetical protein
MASVRGAQEVNWQSAKYRKDTERRGMNPNPIKENLIKAGLGRPKGAKNKFTSLKDNFLHAFNKIGGEEELARWAIQAKNRTAFYQMIARMLPAKIDADIREKKVIIMHLPAKLPKGAE